MRNQVLGRVQVLRLLQIQAADKARKQQSAQHQAPRQQAVDALLVGLSGQPGGAQQGQGRQRRQHVGPENIAGKGEKHGRCQAPQDQIEPQRLATGLDRLGRNTGFAPAPPGQWQQQRPGQDCHPCIQPDAASWHRMGHAITVAGPARGDKAVPVLPEQKIIQKAGRSHFSRHIPGADQQQDSQAAANPRQVAPDPPKLPVEQRPQAQRQAGQYQHQGALGQQTDGQAEKKQPAFPSPLGFITVQAQPEAAHHESCAKRQCHVSHYRTGRDQHQAAPGQQGKGCQRLLSGVPQRPAPHQPSHPQRGQEVRQARGKLVDAQHAKTRRRGPERQGWLAPEGHVAVVPGGDPVTQGKHHA